MLKKVIEIQATKFENSNLKVSCFKTWKDKKAKLNLKRSVLTWIIERLDRKLADAIGNVTSHYGEPFNLIRRFARLYVSLHISLSPSSTIHIGHVLK